MHELEELRKQLTACTVPQKQVALLAKIVKLEKELGIKAPQVNSEDRLPKSKNKEELSTYTPEKKAGFLPT